MAPLNPFKGMPASKPKAPVVQSAQPPVILAQQPASIAPAQVKFAPMRRIPMRPAATSEVVVSTPTPVRQETLAEFKDRTLKESLAASAAANEAARKKQQQRDFGSGPAVNAEPTILTDDERAAAAEEAETQVRKPEGFIEEPEEHDREVVVAEASDPEAVVETEVPRSKSEWRDKFWIELRPDLTPLHVYTDQFSRIRFVSDDRLMNEEEYSRLQNPEKYITFARGAAIQRSRETYVAFEIVLTPDLPPLPSQDPDNNMPRIPRVMEVYLDKFLQMRVVGEDRRLTAEECLMLPFSNDHERCERGNQCARAGVRDPRSYNYFNDDGVWWGKPSFEFPLRTPRPDERPLPPPSSGLKSYRAVVPPADLGRPPMAPLTPRSPSATGRDD